MIEMTYRETIITHLQIIRTWAEFSHERDLNFFTKKHLEDIAKWAIDAIELLKEDNETISNLNETVKNLLQQIMEIKEYMTPIGKVKDVKAHDELLKEHQAVKPKHYEATRYNGELFACGDCKHELEKKPRFCPYCGKEVKWCD